MEYLIAFGIFLLICGGLVGFALGWKYISNKFGIKPEDVEVGKKIIELLIYLGKKGNIKYTGDVEIITKYVFEAISFTEEFNSTTDIQDKKQLVASEALQICKDNGITEDETLIALVSDIVDYFVK